MKRNIAVMAALAIVIVLMLIKLPSAPRENSEGGTSLLSGFSNLFSGGTPNLRDSFNTTVAWSVFQDYLKFAKAHDIERVKSLSYQVSPTYADPAKKAECEQLMDSVYLIANEYKLEDFKHIFYDDQQIIMSSDYMSDEGGGGDDIKVVLYFVKSAEGEAKVLGIRYCFGGDDSQFKCVITDPESRDTDKDGWWDDVEALFR